MSLLLVFRFFFLRVHGDLDLEERRSGSGRDGAGDGVGEPVPVFLAGEEE